MHCGTSALWHFSAVALPARDIAGHCWHPLVLVVSPLSLQSINLTFTS